MKINIKNQCKKSMVMVSFPWELTFKTHLLTFIIYKDCFKPCFGSC